jgi:uroporphyrinogen-III decarboxylase
MSVEVALQNIHLEGPESWAHTEYSLDYHRKFLSKLTGMAEDSPRLLSRAYDELAVDLVWNTNDGMVEWNEKGRVTDMGHGAYASDGSDQSPSTESPFESAEDVWAFDAVEEYGLPDFDMQVEAYEALLQNLRKQYPQQLITGGYYKTIVSGAIAAFGWEMLLLAASDIMKIEKAIDSFYRRTLFHMKAWAQTSAEVIIQHDDFVWASGPFMQPDIYRQVIIPRYAELWKPIHAAGKKVLFCSDGNFLEFAEDVVEAGADGLIFEPCNDFESMVNNFGQRVCLVGSLVDCRDLTFHKWERVQTAIDRTIDLLGVAKGAIIAVGNHLPPNISDEMMEKYFRYLLRKMKRQTQ